MNVAAAKNRRHASKAGAVAKTQGKGAARKRRSPADRDALVAANLGLAYKIAGQWARTTSLDPEELNQEALLGLVLAADYFDPSRGFMFSTFAWKCIQSQLVRLRRQSWRSVGIGTEEIEELALSRPEGVERIDLSILSAREREIIVRRYGLGGIRSQTCDEVAAHVGVTRSRVHQIELSILEKLRAPMNRRRVAV